MLTSWGNFPRIYNEAMTFKHEADVLAHMANNNHCIPFGNGRSYGDSALNFNIIHSINNNLILEFDPIDGILHCQSGVLLNKILETIVPKGWFLAVTPGTKYITIGGAIASDVHGKNHHVAGSFSETVISYRLAMPDGNVIHCSHTENIELFRATCGGMGLTGVILDVKIQLLPIQSSFIDQIIIRTGDLKETFDAFESHKGVAYSVAWIDCLARKRQLGRSLLTVGEHVTEGELVYKNKLKLTIPVDFPSFILNNLSVKTFNTLYYVKAKKKNTQQQVTLDSFFYPLDAIGRWNRVYGRNGFTQYQFVLPKDSSYEGLTQVLKIVAASGKGSFLAVLKLFGKGNSNYLSFPKEGYTLALDFKIESDLFVLFDKLDKIVLDYGGRFYLAKDCRVSQRVFEKDYPDIEKFRQLRKQYQLTTALSSLQSQRVEI